MTYPTLTRDFESYLIRLYFGNESEKAPLLTCINRAYLDFCRTLHGISKVRDAKELHDKALILINRSFQDLRRFNHVDFEVFDGWHETTCRELISVYVNHFKVFGGQAQKWINMTFKYIYTFGEERIPGFEKTYLYCHAPLDNILIAQLNEYGFPPLTCAWSRLNYEEYFLKQKWIRKRFAKPPLDIEFDLWMGNKI